MVRRFSCSLTPFLISVALTLSFKRHALLISYGTSVDDQCLSLGEVNFFVVIRIRSLLKNLILNSFGERMVRRRCFNRSIDYGIISFRSHITPEFIPAFPYILVTKLIV